MACHSNMRIITLLISFVERESLLFNLTEAHQKTSDLEFCIENTVSREEYQRLLLEGTETKQQLEEVSRIILIFII